MAFILAGAGGAKYVKFQTFVTPVLSGGLGFCFEKVNLVRFA